MVVANNIDTVLKNLQKDGLVFGAFMDKEKKILICKTPFFSQYSLPCVRMYEDEEITYLLDPLFRNEFQITPMIKNYIELVRGFYIEKGFDKIGNFICLYIDEYPEYPLKKEPPLKQSGNYTDSKYITYEEALELYKNNEITPYSMYYIFRTRELMK